LASRACPREDAFRSLMGSEIEPLVAGNCLLRKDKRDQRLKIDYKVVYEPD
jgi:carbamoyltransferase